MQIGQRVSFDIYAYEMTSCWDTPWGLVYLYTFKDIMQNVFIWKTSKLIDYDIKRVKSAIVKEFETYQGIKEVVLSYCKVV